MGYSPEGHKESDITGDEGDQKPKQIKKKKMLEKFEVWRSALERVF